MDIIGTINNTFTAVDMAVLAAIFSAAVQALPAPDKFSVKPYRFLYKFFHTLALNWKLVGKEIKKDKEDVN